MWNGSGVFVRWRYQLEILNELQMFEEKSKVSDFFRDTNKSSVGFETNLNSSYSKSHVHV